MARRTSSNNTIVATINITTPDGVNTTINLTTTDLYNHMIKNLRNGVELGEAVIVSNAKSDAKSEAPKQDSKKSTTQNTKTKNTKNTTSSKSTTSAKNTKPVAKKSDDDEFDYAEYIRIAKELDVIRLDGKPWKSMRTTIYAVMNGEMTMKQAEAAKAKVAKKFEKK